MVKRQMELGLVEGVETRPRNGSASPPSRAAWWFDQMRQAVEDPSYRLPRPRRWMRRQRKENSGRDARANELQAIIMVDDARRPAA